MGRQTRPVSYSIYENRCFFDNTHRRYIAEYPLTGNSCATFFLSQIAKTASGSVENQLSYGSPNASRMPKCIENRYFFDNTHRRYIAEYPLTGNSCATFFLCQIAKTASGSVENQLSYRSPNASRSIFDIRKSLFFRQYSQTIHSGIPADRKLVCNIFSLPNSENRIRIG